MAKLNNKEISIQDKSVTEIGEMLREALLVSKDSSVDLSFSPDEEMRLAFDELKHPREFYIPDDTMGQMLGLAANEAFISHMEGCELNFNYSNRNFHLSGNVF